MRSENIKIVNVQNAYLIKIDCFYRIYVTNMNNVALKKY